MFGRLPNLPIDIEMQSESIEELSKHCNEMVEPDHGVKFKEHIVYRKPVTSGCDHGSDSTYTSEDDSSPSNDGSISEDYRSNADYHFPLNGSVQLSDGLGLQLQMEDDAEQPPCSVIDKADNSADGSVIEISNHTVGTVLYLPVCRDWQINACSVVGLQFVKGNHDHNEKPLYIASS
ncbi:hypothetical protein EMCRGX_G010138 [Ephydatia muelleri]